MNDASQCAIAGGGRDIVNTHVQCSPSSGVRQNEEGGEEEKRYRNMGERKKKNKEEAAKEKAGEHYISSWI